MSERTDLIEQIDDLQNRKENAAHRAALLERRCSEIRMSNPDDWRVKNLERHIEALDEFCDNADAKIGQLNRQLWDIEEGMALRDVLADRSYYHWSVL